LCRCHQCAGVFAIVAIAIVARMTMASLPLLMRRSPCRCQAGFIALVTRVLSPLICSGIVALVVMALLPSSSWHHCPHCNGVAVIINVIALIARRQAGNVAVNAHASLQLL
jgi:hypothetical protein